LGCIRTIIDENNHFCRIVVKYLSFVLHKKIVYIHVLFFKKIVTPYSYTVPGEVDRCTHGNCIRIDD